MGWVNGYRMAYYASWRTVTLPCLRYMAGSQASNALDEVAAALDEALAFFAATDPDDVPSAWRKDFDQQVEQLKLMQQGVARWRSAMTRANGLAGSLAGYLGRAEANNAAVRADSDFLVSLYMRFQRAQSRLTMLLATFTAGKASLWRNDPGARLPPLLTGDRIMTILDESRVLDYSRNSGLGLERLVQGAFCDIPLSQGMATITTETFDELRGRIAGLPISDLSTFWEALGKVRNGQELDGLLIRLCQQQTKEAFLAPFQFDDLLARAAGRLADTLAERRAAVGKNQQVIDRETQKFAPILSRLERAIGMAEERTASGDFQAAFGLQYYRDETWRMYGELGARRDDVEAAFAKLDDLIEAARQQLAQGTARNEEAVREFYRQFRQAYEARDEALLMNCMDDDWEAGDGTTLADLEDNLRRTFRIFDEIRVSMENLIITPQDAHTFAVRYDIVITSRIYGRNIRHEEKSMVREEVRLEDGRASISRTIGGRFWYVE
jgi:hypothetical protein